MASPLAASPKAGSYDEAVMCSGMLSATGVYLQDNSDPKDKEAQDNAEVVLNLAKLWVGQAVDLAPDASKILDDVTAAGEKYSKAFNEHENDAEADLEAMFGDDLDTCLQGGAKLAAAANG